MIAEYDGNNNLLRKYIYGPGIDQPVSMIEVADSNAAYYYHYDALGSVIALSDSTGDTVRVGSDLNGTSISNFSRWQPPFLAQ